MFDLKIQRGFIGIAGKQLHRLLVDSAAFSMHERHQHKLPLFWLHFGKALLPHGFLCQRYSHIVLGESLRAIAVQIARKLVEHDDFRQPPA